ncbi:MAG: type II toxin-antitoxin system VapC family toxin [Anaerolineae bacterium]|nr:type II toxin-antitoxin system VapC family toxin [Anaerolineae bacterium]
MTQTIADTSGLYALVDRKDPHHAEAVAFLKTYAAVGSLLVSNHIFDEAMTTVKARLGMQVALQLGIRLRNSRFVEMVVFSTAEEQETWRIFSRYTDKGWSYTDCACLALAQQRNIQQAFSFDHHFRQMGLTILP